MSYYREALKKSDMINSIEKDHNCKVIQAKFLGKSTLEYELENGIRGVRLYETDIILISPRTPSQKLEIITLNSGGFRTQLTKNRINDYLPVYISQNKSVWSISANNYSTIFYDGIQLDRFKNGKLRMRKCKSKSNKEINRNKKLLKLINGYINEFKKLDSIPFPDTGDCWLCMIKSQNDEYNPDCLEQHLKEKYIHGTLIYCALKDQGYKDPGFIMGMNYKDIIARSLKRYFKKHLGIPQ